MLSASPASVSQATIPFSVSASRRTSAEPVSSASRLTLIACAIVGAFLWGADQALRPFVRDVLLGQ